jgi:capsular polysaccharide export protein
MNGYFFYLHNTASIFGNRNFKGWGRKRSGRFASLCKKVFGGHTILFEDGFIRSLGLGVDGSPSFSIVEDDIGIYYDATVPSKLENLLNGYDFKADEALMKTTHKAMRLIREHHISKYNHAPYVDEVFRWKHGLDEEKKRVLIVAQTAGDASLEYGLAGKFTTVEMITDALRENPGTDVYLKVHPDVLTGKKKSDISLGEIPPECRIIDEDVNPISLMEHFDTVYTKTSGMGMEALILGKEVHTYGMPFYAGWGLTHDKLSCQRRKRKLKTEELFAAAYILYIRYYNPYRKHPSDILDMIEEIVRHR